ncbi:hypothetical protein [Sediminibacterium sp.]|uniref:hypothetical protein n=1 Tax=Sediminibacterium sp. TaxID=1917865 RepID=UPI0025F5B4F7|nr:hypothetical protein [Sediminibacterium sp.]MBW0179296.1 hypothetical protein [Sediminibacterium sp.]
MTIDITVTENETPELLEFYHNKLVALREQRNSIDVKERQIEAMISKLLGKTPKEPVYSKSVVQVEQPATTNTDYPQGSTNIGKIAFVLKNSPNPLTSRQIIDAILALDPKLNADKVKAAKNISTVLSINSKENDDKALFKKHVETGFDTKFSMK